MEQMTLLGPDRFTLKPDRKEVFGWLLCGEQLPCYEVYSACWEEAVALLYACIIPGAALLRDGSGSMTVFITLGTGPEKCITGLFEEQRYVIASLLNTLCDEMLFQMDRQTVTIMEELLGPEGLHIVSQQEPLVDLSPLEMKRRLEPLGRVFPEAGISRQGLIYPTKSMMYCVSLSPDGCQGHALHDCTRCTQTNCLYRSTGHET